LRSILPTSLVSRCINFSFATMATPPSDLAFQFKPNMNHEDMLKEMHTKAHTCALSSKLTMQAIICVTMAYEAICSTARASVAKGNVLHVPHTMAEYLALTDRPAHLAMLLPLPSLSQATS
jgi:hypothetical protein